jgi:hypothetical protein
MVSPIWTVTPVRAWTRATWTFCVRRPPSFVDDVQQDAIQADAHTLPGQGRADADLSAADGDAASLPA